MFNLWALLFERGMITSEVNNSHIGVRKSKLCGGYIDECIRVGINFCMTLSYSRQQCLP